MRLIPFLILFRCVTSRPSPVIDPAPVPTIGDFRYAGNGCPQGSASTSLATVNITTGVYQLTTELDAYTPVVRAGLSGTATVGNNCQFKLNIAVPSGWHLRVNNEGTKIHGRLLLLDSNTTATWKATYYFDNLSPSSSAGFYFKGPFDEIFAKGGDIGGLGVSSAGGGGTLAVSTRIALSTKNEKWAQYPPAGRDEYERMWTIATGIEVLKCP